MTSITTSEKVVFGAIIGFAIFGYLQHHYQLLVNRTPSLPYHYYLLKKGDQQIHYGDFVAFKWHGGMGYDAGVTMVKVATALPGDYVDRRGQDFYLHGERVAHAIASTRTGKAINATEAGVVPANSLFVLASNPISIDSRYADFGLVRMSEVIGRAYPIW